MNLDMPVRLKPDNFTPPTRTPWGGRKILEHFKANLDLSPEKAAYPVVGESWEVSVEPSFPSTVADESDLSLPRLLMEHPTAMLGADAERFSGSTPMLVKLLDAADELSVQVHPDDDYEGLESDESGKPECWYIVAAEPGAGLYLGLAPGVTRSSLASALTASEDISNMLNFVPVEPGDTFVIEPGTVHAIGRGVTLVEPQLVYPGRKGKTYRFWDWNRRYNPNGERDPDGKPRELHVAESLAVTDFDGPRGDAFVQQTRRSAQRLSSNGLALDHLCSLKEMQVARLSGSGDIDWKTPETLVAGVAVRGQLSVNDIVFRGGESFVLPAQLGNIALSGTDVEAVLCWMQ